MFSFKGENEKKKKKKSREFDLNGLRRKDTQCESPRSIEQKWEMNNSKQQIPGEICPFFHPCLKIKINTFFVYFIIFTPKWYFFVVENGPIKRFVQTLKQTFLFFSHNIGEMQSIGRNPTHSSRCFQRFLLSVCAFYYMTLIPTLNSLR